MFRHVIVFCLLSLLICSVGCQMCCPPHDYRISGYVDRFDDYRGYNPMYRAGSILSGEEGMVIGNACYVGSTGDVYHNAGNYGFTAPATIVRPHPSTLDTYPVPEPSLIGIPEQPPKDDETIVRPRQPIEGVPTIEDLLNRQRGTSSDAIPVIPPPKPRVVPPISAPSSDDPSMEVIPLSESDEVELPTTIFPVIKDVDSPITLEELRRLDPSVQDVQIISIEDAAVNSTTR